MAVGWSAHMRTMTAAPRTYRASIASVFHPIVGIKTIAYPLGRNAHSCRLPLTDVEITLQADEVFMASTDLGEVVYLQDLDEAIKWSRSEAPDAVVILSPSPARNGITELTQLSLHKRAVPVKP